MAAAWLLTVLALIGVFIGASLIASRTPSAHVAAAGGGLLFGISLFWLVPEIAGLSGWVMACGLTAAVCGCLLLFDRLLLHTGHSPRHGVIGPFLAATAVHSFLDGWSIRALSVQPLASVAVATGLALHKVPEGLALGWITRKSLERKWVAVAAATLVELATLLGAWTEPRARQTGVQTFGEWWIAVVLAIVAGSFLFVGFHATVAERKKAGVVPVFAATFVLPGLIALLKANGTL